MQDYPCTKDVIPRFGLKKWRSYAYSELFSFQTIQGNVENSVFQVAAMASISTSTSCGSFAAWMQVLAGFGDGINYFQRWDCRSFFYISSLTNSYTSFIAAKFCISFKYTLTLTTLSHDEPAASKTFPRFLMHWACEKYCLGVITIKSHMFVQCALWCRLQLFFLFCRLELDRLERSDQGLWLHGLECWVSIASV